MAEGETSEKISLRSFDEDDNTDQPKLSWRGKLAEVLKTNKVQYTIIFLVVLDSLIVVFEMLIDLEIITIPENETDVHQISGVQHENETLANLSAQNEADHHEHYRRYARSKEQYSDEDYVHVANINITTNQSFIYDNDTQTGNHHVHHHSNKELVEHSLHYASLTILAIFVVEVACKIIAEGTHLLKHKAEVFDAIIVLVSFSMDIAFLFTSVTSAARDAAGLMVLLRLWRITRIINGVIMSVKLDADKKISEQKLARVKAEEEVARLRRQLDTLQKDVRRLRGRLGECGEMNGDDRDKVDIPANVLTCAEPKRNCVGISSSEVTRCETHAANTSRRTT